MGNFLDAPLTEKTTEVGQEESKRVYCAMSCMQGWRAQMEDDHIMTLSVPEAPEVSLFGVFDGHGGDHVAHYTARHVQRHFTSSSSFKQPFNANQIGLSFKQAIIQLDAELRTQPEHMSGQDQSGSTLTMVALSPTDVVCANTGDSRSVLCRAGQAIDLSNDHKPYLEGEKERIEKAGGHVKFNRVNGDLAVSRALGDFAYKQREDLPAEVQAVTADPELISQSRTPEDEFIVLACDGIWDVMSSQDVVSYVSGLLRCNERPASETRSPAHGGEGSDHSRHGQPPQPQRAWDLGAVAEALLDKCLEKGSRDNMSVVIVVLKPTLVPGRYGEPDEERRREGGAAAGGAGAGAASRGSGATSSPRPPASGTPSPAAPSPKPPST